MKREHNSCTVIIYNSNIAGLDDDALNRLDDFLVKLYEFCEKYKVTIGGYESCWLDFSMNDYMKDYHHKALDELTIDLDTKTITVCI